MSFWDAASLAAAITIALIGFAANKILDVDFTVFFRRNWKRTKCKKMLAQRKGPWQGTNVQGEIRRAFDLVLLPLGKADKALLPARMDKNFRRRMEGQIELLQRRKLCREIRMTGVVPLPKNGFRHWSDNGREWRESVLQSSALERLLIVKEDRPFYTIFRKEDRKATTPTGGPSIVPSAVRISYQMKTTAVPSAVIVYRLTTQNGSCRRRIKERLPVAGRTHGTKRR